MLITLMGAVRPFRWNPPRSAQPMTRLRMFPKHKHDDAWEPMLTKAAVDVHRLRPDQV